MTTLARLGPSSLSIDVLRAQIAPDASDAELAFFAQVCHRLDLSPWKDQIVLVGRQRKGGALVHRPQITVAGRRTLALRSGLCTGIDGPVWCGPRTHPDAPLVWRDVWDGDGYPYCARTLVSVKGWEKPANGTCKWDEFAVLEGDKVAFMWRRMPSHMLGKCSESLALRRAFPDLIGDALTTIDDIGQVDDERSVVAEAAAVHAIQDQAELTEPAARVVTSDWTPSLDDQAAAHKTIGSMRPTERSMFLANWDIGDFGDAWPPGAVADALGLEVEP